MTRKYETVELPDISPEMSETVTDISRLQPLLLGGARSLVARMSEEELSMAPPEADSYFNVLHLAVVRIHSAPSAPLRLLNIRRPSEAATIHQTLPQHKTHLVYEEHLSNGSTSVFREHMWLVMPEEVDEFDILTSRAVLAWGVVEKIQYILDKKKAQASS